MSDGGVKVSWTTADYISAHDAVRESGKFNFQGCRIPIPTAIRNDRIEAALGPNISSKDKKVVSLLRYGMPINCDDMFGIKSPQKNHHSAIIFKDQIEEYLSKNVSSQAMLGPFEEAPILDLCFSPLMTVPREESKIVSL